MSSLNSIESKHIKQLKSHELIRLLRILLYSEAKKRCAEVHVPLEIEVNDGGEDGHWKGDIEDNEYIPSRYTVYQSKAQGLSPSDCASELLKRTDDEARLKDRVAEVLDAKGCYVFFCAYPYNSTYIKKKIAKAREALKEAGRRTCHTSRNGSRSCDNWRNTGM